MNKKVIKKNDIISLSNKYDLGKYKNCTLLKSKYEIPIFLLETSKNKYIIKTLKLNEKEINFLLNILEKLSSELPFIPKFLNFEYESNIKVNNYYLTIQPYIEGKTITPSELNMRKIEDIIKKQVQFHKITKKINSDIPSHFIKDFNLSIKKESKSHLKKFNLLSEKEKTIQEMNKINFEKFRKGIIHNDLRLHHIIFKNNSEKIKCIIDWDNLKYSIKIYDLIKFISNDILLSKKPMNKLIKTIRIYDSKIKLKKEEKDSIYTLIKFELLKRITENINSPKRLEFIERSIHNKKGIQEKFIKNYIRRYIGFKEKLSKDLISP